MTKEKDGAKYFSKVALQTNRPNSKMKDLSSFEKKK